MCVSGELFGPGMSSGNCALVNVKYVRHWLNSRYLRSEMGCTGGQMQKNRKIVTVIFPMVNNDGVSDLLVSTFAVPSEANTTADY